jgi:hypothetical protein
VAKSKQRERGATPGGAVCVLQALAFVLSPSQSGMYGVFFWPNRELAATSYYNQERTSICGKPADTSELWWWRRVRQELIAGG